MGRATALRRSAFMTVRHVRARLPIGQGFCPVAARDVPRRGIDPGSNVTYRNIPVDGYLAVRTSHVRATGTAATSPIAEV
jgi:hypothetical protein